MKLQYVQSVEAVMGQYLRTYEPRTNLNTILNSLRSPRYAFHPSAVIVRGKRYPDVSFYQGMIDWDQMREQTDTVIIRAGQNEWVDPQFFRNWTEAHRRNMRRGVYFFYDGRKSPGFQADLLSSLIRNDPPEMEIIIDWEHNYGGGYEGLQNVVAMMQRLEDLFPDRRVGLYTGYYWFTANSNPITNASQYDYLKDVPLWLAWYTDDPSLVRVPAPWTRLTLWQYGTPSVGELYGVDTVEIDMNFWNGTEAEFYQRYGGVVPPVEEGTMERWKVLVGLKVRSGSSIVFPQVQSLVVDDTVEGVLDPVTNWINISRIIRANGNELAPTAGTQWWCSGFSSYVELIPPTPDPELPETLDFIVDVVVNLTGYAPKTLQVHGELERA